MEMAYAWLGTFVLSVGSSGCIYLFAVSRWYPLPSSLFPSHTSLSRRSFLILTVCHIIVGLLPISRRLDLLLGLFLPLESTTKAHRASACPSNFESGYSHTLDDTKGAGVSQYLEMKIWSRS
jgi:hypothetical protein